MQIQVLLPNKNDLIASFNNFLRGKLGIKFNDLTH